MPHGPRERGSVTRTATSRPATQTKTHSGTVALAQIRTAAEDPVSPLKEEHIAVAVAVAAVAVADVEEAVAVMLVERATVIAGRA